MFTYPTKEANHPRAIGQLSVPPMGLPINYPSLVWPINYPPPVWPINYPTLAWPPRREGIGLALRPLTFVWPANISHGSTLNHITNRVVLPWPLYAPNLPAFWLDMMQTDSLDSAVVRATVRSHEQDKDDTTNHKSDSAVVKATVRSHEQAKSNGRYHNHDWIRSVLSEQIVQQNIVTDVKVTEDMITVYISPVISSTYVRPDCQNPTTINRYDSDTITVQGLGIGDKAVRYVVDMVRLRYINDDMIFKVFTVPVKGMRSDLKVTDEVVEMSMYFIIDRNLSLRIAAEILNDLYRVETSSSALDRWKIKEAEALPSIGQLIQQLNAKKAITQLHLDEYKAKGTKSWELCIKDEHGRLIFSIAPGERDTWHIKVILRWFRILGLKIEVFYCDFWLSYPPAIRAIYPKAEIQFDF